MLTPKKVDHFKRLVEERIAELNRSIEAGQEQARVLATRHPDAMDQAAIEYERQAALYKVTTDRQLRQTLTRTLERIHTGKFGECAECGAEIEQKRLEAIPWAQYCIKCQEAMEKEL
jgi:DnaK suppressor protein